MTRHSPSSIFLLMLALFAIATAAAFTPPDASAQTLKLASLRVFPSDVVGPWVAYRVRTQSGRTPVREFRQRVAIVSREKVASGDGYWVELKTVDRAGTRIERGLFAPGRPRTAEEPGSVDSEVVVEAGQPLRLV